MSNPGRVDDLADFEVRQMAFDGVEKRVFVAGEEGPAVIVLPEMPGISHEVARFSRWVRDAGFRVFVPSLFGTPGAASLAQEGAQVMKRACVSEEFRVLAGGGTSPVSMWLRHLARAAHAECGGPGVGAVGMCFTGNFALTMAIDPAVVAPVLGQPSLPLDDPGGLEISAADATLIQDRFERDHVTALGLRFAGDRWCTGQRFAAYAALLGPRFREIVVPDSAANPDPQPFFAQMVVTPHSVLTAHLVDESGSLTMHARNQVLDFLRQALVASPG